VELERLTKWVILKSAALDDLRKSCKAFKAAHKKRVDKQEYVRDNVYKELNHRFHRCSCLLAAPLSSSHFDAIQRGFGQEKDRRLSLPAALSILIEKTRRCA
jgi:hypothetical protein